MQRLPRASHRATAPRDTPLPEIHCAAASPSAQSGPESQPASLRSASPAHSLPQPPCSREKSVQSPASPHRIRAQDSPPHANHPNPLQCIHPLQTAPDKQDLGQAPGFDTPCRGQPSPSSGPADRRQKSQSSPPEELASPAKNQSSRANLFLAHHLLQNLISPRLAPRHQLLLQS